jgi:hypothetical protein
MILYAENDYGLLYFVRKVIAEKCGAQHANIRKSSAFGLVTLT